MRKPFFTWRVSAGRITERHFIEAGVPLRQFDGNFLFEADLPRANGEASKHRPAENLLAGLNAGEMEMSRPVAEPCQKRGPGQAGARKAGAVNDIRDTVEQGLEKLRVVGGIIFRIGILEQDEIACAVGNARTDGGAFSCIFGHVEDLKRTGIFARQAIGDFCGGSDRASVDHEDFAAQSSGQRSLEDARQGPRRDFALR